MKLNDYGNYTIISLIKYKPYIYDDIRIQKHLNKDEVIEYTQEIGDPIEYKTYSNGNLIAYWRIMSDDDLDDHQ